MASTIGDTDISVTAVNAATLKKWQLTIHYAGYYLVMSEYAKLVPEEQSTFIARPSAGRVCCIYALPFGEVPCPEVFVCISSQHSLTLFVRHLSVPVLCVLIQQHTPGSLVWIIYKILYGLCNWP